MVCFVRLKQPKDFCIQKLSFVLAGCCEEPMFSLTSFNCVRLNAEPDHEHCSGSSVNEPEGVGLMRPRALLSIRGTVASVVGWDGAAKTLTLGSCRGVQLMLVLAVQGCFPPGAPASPAQAAAFHTCTTGCNSKSRGRPK